MCKHPLGVEGLRRIDAMFAADALFADHAPAQRRQLRDEHLRPLLDACFAWVEAQRIVPRERGLVASALGDAHNQHEPLRRFLEDGRLRMDNNRSERVLRAIAAARKSWLFFGSDDHADATANLTVVFVAGAVGSLGIENVGPNGEAVVIDASVVEAHRSRDVDSRSSAATNDGSSTRRGRPLQLARGRSTRTAGSTE